MSMYRSSRRILSETSENEQNSEVFDPRNSMEFWGNFALNLRNDRQKQYIYAKTRGLLVAFRSKPRQTCGFQGWLFQRPICLKKFHDLILFSKDPGPGHKIFWLGRPIYRIFSKRPRNLHTPRPCLKTLTLRRSTLKYIESQFNDTGISIENG